VFAGEHLIYAGGLGMDAGGHGADADVPQTGPGDGRGVRLCWCPDDPADPRGTSPGRAATV